MTQEEFEQAIEKKTERIEQAPAKLSVFQILQKRYPPNEYALLKEVRDKAGFYASRSADFVAVNLWPSRGLAMNGIELKSFRSDWLNEMKNPAKAENIFQYCDYFWLLTADDSVAKIEEIPDTWGWLSIKNEKIFVRKEAPKLQPVIMTRHFVCAMLKRACDKTDFIHIDHIQNRIDSARESEKSNKAYKLERAEKERDELLKIISEFKDTSGIDLQSARWMQATPKEIGKAVKFIQSGGVDEIKKQLLGLEKTAEIVLKRITEGLQSLEHPKQ